MDKRIPARRSCISIAAFVAMSMSFNILFLLGSRRVPSALAFTLRSTTYQSRRIQSPRPSSALNSCLQTSLFSSSSSTSTSTDDVSAVDLDCPLPFDTLPYRGAEVRVPPKDQSDDDDADFLSKLRTSIQHWTDNDYTSAWLHVPSSRAGLVEALTGMVTTSDDTTSSTSSEFESLSFDLHHVNATESTIVLKKWLRPHAEDKIPPFATHQVGCAGFVLSEDNEILLVREWSGPPSNRTPTKQWKLPGGLLDAGESFEEAACREVVEETGVRSDFESVLAFWHRHNLVFGKSDFYFVCLLRPKSKEINIDPVEVSAAKWMPLEEFITTQDHPLIHHVLRNAFKLGGDKGCNVENALEKLRSTKGRIKPAVEMLEGDVKFGNRDPFLTYTGSVNT